MTTITAKATEVRGSARYSSVYEGEIIEVDYYLDRADGTMASVDMEWGDDCPGHTDYKILSALAQQPEGRARPYVRVRALKPASY